MKTIITAAIAVYALLGTIAFGGTFRITDEDLTTVSVHYTGGVTDYDVYRWYAVEKHAGDRVIILTIDSPGGSAYGGIDLYWALEAHPRLVTVAGGQMGAWSAAAIMWTAGDYQLIAPNGAVWFHAAFCQWDPEPNPDIGCDTTRFQIQLVAVLTNAGYWGLGFNSLLNAVQNTHGTDGWIGLDSDGWWMRDTTDWWKTRFDITPFLLR